MAAGSSNPTTNVVKVAGTAVDTNTGNASAGTQRVVLASNQPAVAVTGTFYQATQPVSGTFWPTTQPVSGTFWQATQPVSLTSLPALATGTNAIGSITNTSFAATQSGTWNIGTVTNLSQLGGTAISMNTGIRDAGTQRVTIATNDSVPVTGTFWQATQPVSGTFWQTTQPVSGTVSINAIPAGTNAIGSITNTSFAATQSGTWNIGTVTNLSQLGGTAISMNTGVRDAGTQRVTIATNDSVPVTGTFWQTTQPVSAAALPLPTGAATSAKQPALGTAGTASADVITVQGIAGGVAQPVSGSVTVTQATAGNLNATVTGTVELGATSLAALENISVTVPGTVDLGTVSLTALETITVTSGTPGNFQSRGYGAVTTAAPAYTTGTDNALSLTTSGALRVDNSAVTQPVSGTFWQTTQPVSGPLTDSQLRAAAVPVSLSTLPTLATVTNLVQFNGTAISMKAGSTAPAAADPALVVSLSPNSQQLATPGTPFASAVTTGGTLPASTIYYIKIVAVDAGGGTTAASGQLVYGTAAGTNTNVITLSWVPVAGADSYQVWWGIASSAQNNYFNAPINLSTSGELLNSYVFSTVSGSFSGTIPATNTSSFVRQKPTQPVSIAASVAVTGPLTDSQLRAAAVPVSLASVPTHGVTGTFWQTTQPVSQTVGSAATRWYTQLSDGTNSPAIKAASTAAVAADPSLVVSLSPNNTLGVTGTFWQATQPVSGPLTDSQLRAAAVPVTGTITSLTQMNGQAISMNTGVRDAGTQRVTIATNDSVTVSGTVAATQSGTWTVQPGNTANTTPWLIKPLESLGTATALGGVNVEIAQALNGSLGAAAVITAIAAPVGITLTPYASYDGGTNWTVTQFFNSANGDAISTLTTFAVGDSYSISAGDGATHVKVKVTAVSTGTVTVRLSATNSQGLVNLKSTAVHDDPAGSFVQQMGAVASSTAPTAVSANGDAVRLWATTSGALNIADGGGSITVDGAFYQATQPVSIASMPSTPVTGTFWQATQPVSIASMPSTPVTGTFWQATQPVSLTSLPALAAGTAAIGTVTAVGTAASGATSTGNPVVVGGVDGGGLARPILVATDGAVKLGASTAAIGKLSANAGVNIGAVEVVVASRISVSAYTNLLQIKASAGTLYTINGYNSKTTGQFIQLIDSSGTWPDGTVPVLMFYVPASSNFSFDMGVYGMYFSGGIMVCNSSTGPTKTLGASDCWFAATYK